MYNGGTYERLEFLNNMVPAVLMGDEIFQCDMYGRNQTKIGVSLKKYNEATSTLQKYYEKLVELGIIQEEKKPEDMMKEFMEEIRTLRQEIQHLKEDKDDEHDKRDVTNGEQDVRSGPSAPDDSVHESTSGDGRSEQPNASSRKSRSK